MMPAHAATQNDPAAGDVQVVERVRRAALADDEARPARSDRDRRQPDASAPLFGTGAKLIARISAPTSTTERTPPRLSTGSVVSFTWPARARSPARARPTASGSVTQEDRAPPEVLEQRPGEQRAERGDRAADRRPQRDRLRARRARPQRGDQRERRRVRHAGRRAPPSTRATNSTSSDGAHAASRRGGDRQRDAERSASSCGRSGRRARRGRAPTRRGRASSRPRSGRASSATSRTPCRCRAARRWRPRGSGWRPPRPGSASRGRARRAPGGWTVARSCGLRE